MTDKRARFEATVLPHLDSAYRFARWLAHSGADADDVLQEAILRAYRAFDGLRGTDVKAWLFTIVRNCHYTALRQERGRAFVPLPEEHDLQDGHVLIEGGPGPEAATINRDHERVFDRLVSALPEKHREVLVLREVEEMDYREIAKVTNVPIGTVMSRLARARAALLSQWRAESPGDAHVLP
jgi:RNA polymerase sigma factor (sigma-70 family)